MNRQDVDTDKILKHIEYTKHWLDKANKNYQEKSFANGGVTLNLARAELTAAWEEAMQLKTHIFKTIPRKAKSNWKPMTSVGMLASGFLIAFFMIRFTNNTVPELGESRDYALPAAAIEQTVETPAADIEIPMAPVEIAPAQKPRAASSKTSAHAAKSAAAAPEESHAPAMVPARESYETQPAPATVETVAAPEKPAAPAQRELSQSEIIELMKAAERALVK